VIAEEVVANHVLLGERITPEKLIDPQAKERTAVGGQKLNFKVDENGEIWMVFKERSKLQLIINVLCT